VKLGTVRTGGEQRVVVALDDQRAVALEPGISLAGLLRDWAAGERTARRALEAGQGQAQPAGGLDWLPPIPRPGKVICLALNNSANVDRIISGPKTPAAFLKPASCLIGSGQPIRLLAEYGRVHPEPELAVVIGPGGASIPAGRALEHVFGYTILNDLTSPTMRAEDTFHYRAIHPKPDGSAGIQYVDTWVSYPNRYKGADTFGPIGPWVVTADSVPDPHDLTVTCVHDGRVVTADSTANLLHKVPEVISYISRYQTLEPGDIIAMGTALKPSQGGSAVQNVDLAKLGGRIEVSISGIGTLSNPVELS
jgi:2-keto-4-pentenoate hydratase/2-oxohepta-3-ene-1,7-dioic acid hydratase in catechol pathway